MEPQTRLGEVVPGKDYPTGTVVAYLDDDYYYDPNFEMEGPHFIRTTFPAIEQITFNDILVGFVTRKVWIRVERKY